MVSEEKVARVIEEGRAGGAREVLMISGERPGAMAHIQEELGRRGYGDFWKFAAAVAGFGMVLRNSPYRGGTTLSDVLAWGGAALGDDPGGARAEFLDLVHRARDLRGER